MRDTFKQRDLRAFSIIGNAEASEWRGFSKLVISVIESERRYV